MTSQRRLLLLLCAVLAWTSVRCLVLPNLGKKGAFGDRTYVAGVDLTAFLVNFYNVAQLPAPYEAPKCDPCASETCFISWAECDVSGLILSFENIRIKTTLQVWGPALAIIPVPFSVRAVNSGLTGTLPANWMYLQNNLVSLDLSNNRLSGDLPFQWGYLKNLKYLSLTANKYLGGTLPWAWGYMSNLTDLYLNGNQFRGTLPPQWLYMKSLVNLDVQRNQLNGTLPREWSSMALLSLLHLNSNNFTGGLPSQWSRMQSLGLLRVDKNYNLAGSVPSTWKTMGRLRDLDVTNTKVGGCVWWPLTYITKLSNCPMSQPKRAPPPPRTTRAIVG